MGLQLTRGGEYAMRAMTYLARFPEGHVASLHDIGQAQDIPESFLAKILQSLVHAGSRGLSARRARRLRPGAPRRRDHDARGHRGRGRARRSQPVRALARGVRAQRRLPGARGLDARAGAAHGRARRVTLALSGTLGAASRRRVGSSPRNPAGAPASRSRRRATASSSARRGRQPRRAAARALLGDQRRRIAGAGARDHRAAHVQAGDAVDGVRARAHRVAARRCPG